MLISNPEEWIGLDVDDYKLHSVLGHGRIGYVFLATHRQVKGKRVACKIILEGGLKPGWEREIEKVAQLEGISEVAPVVSWGTGLSVDHRPFSFILYQYVEGSNLKNYIQEKGKLILSEVEAIASALLRALHAFSAVGIEHGDLHAGNVLISDPDRRIFGAPRRIVVTDFGYGGSHNEILPKNDRHHVSAIVLHLLGKLRADELGARDRAVRERLIEFFQKDLIETYHQPVATSSPSASDGDSAPTFFGLYKDRVTQAEVEAARGARGSAGNSVDDYLNAEALGHRKEEWQNLFVPQFLGAESFTSKNVSIITGARGCGKTMAFRRLTLFMDELIGESSGVSGADDIVGLYLNCRDIIEAFPYIPKVLRAGARRHVVHFFHLCWLIELTRALAQRELRTPSDNTWLVKWIQTKFPKDFRGPELVGEDAFGHIRAFLDEQKEVCRTWELGRDRAWALDRIDLLDDLVKEAVSNIPWLRGRPLHFFLDDYTIPLLTEQVQAALNPVIFKRRPHLFFKVSTEAANSFLRMYGEKPLEENHDFALVDLANETLHREEKQKAEILSAIFSRRLQRADDLGSATTTLELILGASDDSFNGQARKLREQASSKMNAPVYYGVRTFVGMWSSDIRSMIQLFSELLRQHKSISGTSFPIDKSLQQSRFSESGGEFMNLTDTIRDAGFWDGERRRAATAKAFGKTLRNVAQAFISICRWELTSGPLMKNQTGIAPKQAFRIEVIDELELPKDLLTIYQGLIRWHVFMPDWRGRSVRGVMTPRIFLNRRLIPYGRLSFSSKDSISLTSMEFQQLLRHPTAFPKYWKSKRAGAVERARATDNGGQISIEGLSDDNA